MPLKWDDGKRYAIVGPEEFRLPFLRLKRENPHLDLAFYAKEEAINLFGYETDPRALSFLLKAGYQYSRAQEVLEAFCAPFFEKTAAESLLNIKSLRDELIDKDYLHKTPYPERSFVSREVLLYPFASSERLSLLLGECSSNMSVGYLPPLPKRPLEKRVPCYAYRDFYEEAHGLLNAVASELEAGTKPDDIYVYGLSDPECLYLLERLAPLYGFSFDASCADRIYDHPAYREFKKRYGEGLSLLEARESVLLLFPERDVAPLLEEAYALLDPNEPLDRRLSILDEIAKAKRFASPKMKGAVHVASSFYLPPGKVAFAARFLSGVYPSSHKDEGFLSSEERKEIGLLSAEEKMADERAAAISLLHSPNLRWLSFSQETFGKEHWPSGFLASETPAIEKAEPPSINREYSHFGGLYYLSYLQDMEKRSGSRLPLTASYKAIQDPSSKSLYRSYVSKEGPLSFQFNGLLPGITKKRGVYSISATSYGNFAECPFRYLVLNGLGLNAMEDDFNSVLGDIFHKVRELHFLPSNRGRDHSSLYEEALAAISEKRPFTPREEYLFARLEPHSADAFAFGLEHESHLASLETTAEGSFEMEIEEGLYLNGRYDRIDRFEKDGVSFVEIVDYKTGSSGVYDRELFDSLGLSAQLPFYITYVKGSERFEGDTFLGAFIAPIWSEDANEFKRKPGSSSYRLNGPYLADSGLWKELDLEHYYKLSLLEKKEGFREDAKNTYSEEEFGQLMDKVKERLKAMRDLLERGRFVVEPKRYAKPAVDACKGCPARDVCFRPEEGFPKYQSPVKEGEEPVLAADEDEESDDGA